jgi:hypothetical protein
VLQLSVTVELVDFTTYAPNSRKILTRAELDQKEHWQGLTRVCDGSIADRWYALSAACTVYQKPITTTRYSIATLTLYCDLTACLFFSSLLGSSWRQLEIVVIVGLPAVLYSVIACVRITTMWPTGTSRDILDF